MKLDNHIQNSDVYRSIKESIIENVGEYCYQWYDFEPNAVRLLIFKLREKYGLF